MGSSGHHTGAARESTPVARSHRFPKEKRLLSRQDFLALQRTGRKFHGRHFLAVIAPRASLEKGHAAGRIGITTSKKVGNAVTRNRLKRFIREYVRQHDWVLPGTDVVIIAKPSAAEIRHYDVVAADLSRIGSRMASCG